MAPEMMRQYVRGHHGIDGILNADAASEGNMQRICSFLDKVRGPFREAEHELLQKVFKCLQSWSLTPVMTKAMQRQILPILARIYDDLMQCDHSKLGFQSSVLELVFIVEDLSETNAGKIHCGNVFLLRLLTLATAKAPSVRLQRAATEAICALVTKSPENQQALLDEKTECYNLFKTFLPKCGDFQLQASVTEIFYRLLKRGPQLLELFQDKLVREAAESLLRSKQQNLMGEIRRVVMLLNESLGSFRSVYSFLAEGIHINGRNVLTTERWINFGKSQLSFYVCETSEADPEEPTLVDVSYDSIATLKRSSTTHLEICLKKTEEFPVKTEVVDMGINCLESKSVDIHISFKPGDLSKIDYSVLPKIRGWSIAQLAKTKPAGLNENHERKDALILETSATAREPLTNSIRNTQSLTTAAGDLKRNHEMFATDAHAQVNEPMHTTDPEKRRQVPLVPTIRQTSEGHRREKPPEKPRLVGDCQFEDGYKDSNSDPHQLQANDHEQARPTADCNHTGVVLKERIPEKAASVHGGQGGGKPSDANPKQLGNSAFICHSTGKTPACNVMSETRDVTFELRTKRRQDICAQKATNKKAGPSRVPAYRIAGDHEGRRELHGHDERQDCDQVTACEEIPETPECMITDQFLQEKTPYMSVSKSSQGKKTHATAGESAPLEGSHKNPKAGVKGSVGVSIVHKRRPASRSLKHRQCKKTTKYFESESDSDVDAGVDVSASSPPRSRGDSGELRGSGLEFGQGNSSESAEKDDAVCFRRRINNQKCSPFPLLHKEISMGHQKTQSVQRADQPRPEVANEPLIERDQNCSLDPDTPQRSFPMDVLNTQENIFKDTFYCKANQTERQAQRAGKVDLQYPGLFTQPKKSKEGERKSETLQQQSGPRQGSSSSESPKLSFGVPASSPPHKQTLNAQRRTSQEATSTSEESEKVRARPGGQQHWRSLRMRKLDLPEMGTTFDAKSKKKPRPASRMLTSSVFRQSLDEINPLSPHDDDPEFVEESGIDHIEKLLKSFKRKVKAEEKRKIDEVLRGTAQDLQQELRLTEEREKEKKEEYEALCKKRYEELDSKLRGHAKKLRVLYEKFQQDFATHLNQHEHIFSEINDSELDFKNHLKQRAQEREKELVRLQDLCEMRLTDAKQQIHKVEEESRSLHGLKDALKGILPDLP